MWSRRSSMLAALAVLAVVYGVAGKLSLALAFLQPSVSPVWPPAGIALVALLVLGYQTWPAIFIGAFLTNALITAELTSERYAELALKSGETVHVSARRVRVFVPEAAPQPGQLRSRSLAAVNRRGDREFGGVRSRQDRAGHPVPADRQELPPSALDDPGTSAA